MTYNTRSAKAVESSQQGTLRSIQEEIQGNKEGTNEKIDRLQEAIEKLVTGMKGMMHITPQRLEERLDEEEEIPVVTKNKGVFRNPAHAAMERKKLEHQQYVI